MDMFSAHFIWVAGVSVVAGLASPIKDYTYRSPSIKALSGVRFQWKLTNGWRLITPAESSVYKPNTMTFTLVRPDAKLHGLRRVDGMLLFLSSTAKPVSARPDDKGLVMRAVPLWGTNKVLWATIRGVPSSERAYWTAILGGISYVQSKGISRGHVQKSQR